MLLIGRATDRARMQSVGSNCGCAMLVFGNLICYAGLCLSGFLVIMSVIVGLLAGGYGLLVGLT